MIIHFTCLNHQTRNNYVCTLLNFSLGKLSESATLLSYKDNVFLVDFWLIWNIGTHLKDKRKPKYCITQNFMLDITGESWNVKIRFRVSSFFLTSFRVTHKLYRIIVQFCRCTGPTRTQRLPLTVTNKWLHNDIRR